MAITDAKLLFSDGQALTAAAETKATNEIKLPVGKDAFGNTLNDQPGEGGARWLNVRVSESFTMATSTGTVICKLYGSATSGGTDNLLLTGAAVAEPVAGTALLKTPLPAGDLGKHLNLTYTLSTSASAGAVDAWLGLDHQSEVGS